jgi:hypothetical protein
VLRRLSFGLNGGATTGTSLAIAYGLILNYLDHSFNGRVLPSILKAESLRGSDWRAERYPQTILLHNYLLRRCRLKPNLWGLRGKEVIRRIRRFWRRDPWQTGVIVRCAFGGYGSEKAWKLIRREVRHNRPAMVTTNYPRLRGKGEFFPTLMVCGYRVTESGRREVLVHPGRYDSYVKGSRAQLIYISLDHILCSYRFDIALLPSSLP